MAEKEEKILSLQQELDALSANITNSEPKRMWYVVKGNRLSLQGDGEPW